jgi:hypothetical protein
MISQATIENALSTQFHDKVRLKLRRPDILQVYAPFYHEDGDMVDMFIEPRNGGVRVCDFGKTLMRLSYSFNLDTENKRRIFNELLAENKVEFDDDSGNIFIDTTEDNICNSVLHFSQVVAKVSRLDILRRELVSNLFFEMLNEFIESELAEFKPRFDYIPIPGRDDLTVTCAFEISPTPAYLFAVRNSSQARLAAISFLEFQKAKLRFRGLVAHDDIESLPKNDRRRITSAADKQFISLEDFRDNAARFLSRQVA